MTPWIRIELRKPVFPWLWLKIVSGFSPRHCCAKCLLGRYWDGIPWTRQPAL